MSGYIDVNYPKEHCPRIWHIPTETPCIKTYIFSSCVPLFVCYGVIFTFITLIIIGVIYFLVPV
jgi:hypothetical protein